MNVSPISFKSAYVSEEAKFFLKRKQKSAVYNWGYTHNTKHLKVSLKHDDNNFPVGIIFRIIDKFTKKEQARSLLRLNASDKAITNKLKTLSKNI